ncbi:MAG TPA: aspartate aminotransferase family protein [Candidatus Polarisedimenticolia bacterium]|nr:aspartate aminotransferase family protein [Candidatus Polarisedimenticolia bacterium]
MSSFEGIVNRYVERTRKSRELWNEAKGYLPRGVSSNFRVIDPHPIFIESAIGTTLTDADGNQYRDFAMAFGAMLTGHTHPAVVKAIEAQARKGTLHAMPHRLEVSVARELRRRFGQDQWRFANSGTEATMHSIRLARGYTGRSKVIKFEGGYHGGHDTVLVSTKAPIRVLGSKIRPRPIPASDGIPEESYAHTLMATFNDLGTVRRRFEENLNEVACLIVEPIMLNMGVTEPDPDFLPGLRALCDEFEALLIFDEVKTGVKIAPGGATEHYKVRPDIVCLAKAIGGGLPLAAFGASAEIMEELNSLRVIHVGTYASNPLTLAAAEATLKEVLTDDAYKRIFALNRRLVDGYASLIREHKLPFYANGVGCMGTINFKKDRMRNYRDWAAHDKKASAAWYLAMMSEGILPQPAGPDEQWTISAQHTDADIDAHLKTFEKVIPLLKSL